MKNYLKMLRFLRGHEKLFVLSVVIMLVASFFEVFQFTMVVPMVDVVFNNKDGSPSLSSFNGAHKPSGPCADNNHIFSSVIIFLHAAPFYVYFKVGQRIFALWC